MRLMIVDDSPLDRALVSEIGAAHGIEVVEATDGDSATAAIDGVAVALLDGHIPGHDVHDIAARIRAASPATRVVLWSGLPGRVARGMPAGAVDGVYQKPTDLADLEAMLTQLSAVV